MSQFLRKIISAWKQVLLLSALFSTQWSTIQKKLIDLPTRSGHCVQSWKYQAREISVCSKYRVDALMPARQSVSLLSSSLQEETGRYPLAESPSFSPKYRKKSDFSFNQTHLVRSDFARPLVLSTSVRSDDARYVKFVIV